jgi:alcohol dehydrogenase
MIQAVVFDGTVRVVERSRPEIAPDEVLIGLRLAGICNTDLEITRGYKGFAGTLGHEFVGDVLAGPPEWIGRRVVGEINVTCGACDMCRRGISSQCRQRRALGISNYDGAFAAEFRLAARNLFTVPESIPDEAAVFTEPLAAACQILEAVHIQPRDTVILIGAGKLGLLAAQVLRLTGADLSVIVRQTRQADLLAQWGIRAVSRADVPDQMADVVVDCTGNESGFADALTLVRPRGTIVLKSTYAGNPQADLTRLVVDEIRVVGSRCGPFGAALRLLEAGLVDVLPLIETRYALADAAAALAYAAQPDRFKVLLDNRFSIGG